MATMISASSPLSAQSFVKLRTNSNYYHPSCYVPSSSRVHLSYKNISHIGSSKSLFTKVDGNFSFSSPKFPRAAPTCSPSLNIIKACSMKENVYHFSAYDLGKNKKVQLNEDYQRMVLLMVNIPLQGSKWSKGEIEFLNDLCKEYKYKTSKFGRGFQVLGFFHDIKDLVPKKREYESEKEGIPKLAPGEEEILMGEKEIREVAEFPLFGKVNLNDDHESYWRNKFIPKLIQDAIDEDLWYFLRKSMNVEKIEEEFEKFLVDGRGKPVKHFVRYDGETLKPRIVKEGEFPGDTIGSGTRIINPTSPVKDAIDVYFKI